MDRDLRHQRSLLQHKFAFVGVYFLRLLLGLLRMG
jgi:hypothetical protein